MVLEGLVLQLQARHLRLEVQQLFVSPSRRLWKLLWEAIEMRQRRSVMLGLGVVVAACAQTVEGVGLQGWRRLWFIACGDWWRHHGMVEVW